MRLLRISLLALCSVTALVPDTAATSFQRTAIERFQYQLALQSGGSLHVKNLAGNIVIRGTDQPGLTIQAAKVIRGVDDAAVKDGVGRVQLIVAGTDSNRRLSATGMPGAREPRWDASVFFSLGVPRSTSITIEGYDTAIQVHNVDGLIVAKNVKGDIQFLGSNGALTADTINGNLLIVYKSNPSSYSKFSTVNGYVELRVPPRAAFKWIAETIRGEIYTSLPVVGDFDPRASAQVFEGVLNSAGTATVLTSSISGKVVLLAPAKPPVVVRRLVPATVQLAANSPASLDLSASENFQSVFQATQGYLLAAPRARTFALQKSRIGGSVDYRTKVGSVLVARIEGHANIQTGAGEVVLGQVAGRCDVVSNGGPINVGDVGGIFHLHTVAGDITLRSSKSGGVASTGGGSILVGQTSAPVVLTSKGGDIIVRDALSRVRAETRSGDIRISMNPAVRGEQLQATTIGGNIILNIGTGFSATVDATILTTDEAAHSIESELPGLSILRERVGDKTRIRATGNLNGGGNKVTLHAENGSIRIRRH